LGVENGHSRHPKWPRTAPIQMDRKCILPTLVAAHPQDLRVLQTVLKE
jgi:hypothetical protein